MEFRLDEGQVALQETVDRFCTDTFPLDDLAARESEPVDRNDWRALADLGVLGLTVPEEAGGVGLDVVDAAIVFEQLGRHLAPGPLVWTFLAASAVDGAVAGDTIVAGVESRHVVDGVALVPHAADADVVVVLDDDTLTVHPAADLEIETLDSLDPLATIARVRGLRTDGAVTGAAAARRLGTVLAAAQLVGVAHRSLDVARDYAVEREQFGVPIGSFQAVKHMVADMYVRAMPAQSAVYAAAAILDDPGRDDPDRAVAGAKLLAADAALTNASAAIQVLGGMGFTWEMLPNYLLKRAWALDGEFGTVEDHEVELGTTLALR